MVAGQLLRFGGVGGLATLVHVVVAMLMRSMFELSPLQANFAGFSSAILLSYVGHARCTFGVEVTHGFQFLRFLSVGLIALATSTGTVWLLDIGLGLDFGIAMVAVAVMVPAATYLAMRFWVFRTTGTQDEFDWLGLATSGALALAILTLFWGRMINHDTAWYLIATRDWLGGSGLYTTLVEVNPPLNFYLTLPAIGFADLFGISDTNGQYVALAALIFLVLNWCNVIAREELGFPPAKSALLLCGIALALVLPALNNFGQREQVMVVLTMPWLLGQIAPVPASTGRQIARAAVAAIGICLKPHFVVFPLAVTALMTLRRRSLRPLFSIENLTFLAVGLGYIGYVALVHPAYLSEIVPMAQQIYGAYGTSFDIVFHKIRYEMLLALVPVIVALSLRLPQIDAGLFAVVALAGLGSYFLQGTGFEYHAIPFRAFALVACCLLVLQNPGLNSVTIAAVIAALGLMAINVERGFYSNRPALEIAAMASEIGQVDSLMVLSSYVHAGPPAAIASGADWSSRYPTNWLVPGALNRLQETDCQSQRETCDRLSAIATKNRTDNLADIAASRPDLLVFDLRLGYFGGIAFSWAAFMAEDPAWPTVFGEYTEMGQSERFAYYARKPRT
jgi:putative flippase GtrA